MPSPCASVWADARRLGQTLWMAATTSGPKMTEEMAAPKKRQMASRIVRGRIRIKPRTPARLAMMAWMKAALSAKMPPALVLVGSMAEYWVTRRMTDDQAMAVASLWQVGGGARCGVFS